MDNRMSQRIKTMLVGVAAVAAAGAAAADTIGPRVAEAIASEGRARVVVMLRAPETATASTQPKAAAIATLQSRVLSRLSTDDLQLSSRWRLIPGFAGRLSATGLAKLQADPLVARVDLDVPGQAHLAQSVPMIRANVVQAQGYTGQGVTVAVLDSGVNRSHPDLAGAVVDEQCYCEDASGFGCCPDGWSSQSGTGAARDDNGHGTNVAGIIASRGTTVPKGVAPGASLVAVRVLAADGSFASTSQVVSGLDWLASNHPETKVVNMSLGTSALFSGDCDDVSAWAQAFATAIGNLRNQGTLTFVSSGNQRSTSQIAVPACISSAVAVGAVYKANVGAINHSWAGCSDSSTAADKVVCFSNTSSALDLLAPGSPIVSTGYQGGTSTYSGTSQASPHAAGTAALLFHASPGATPAQVETAMKSSGVTVTDHRTGQQFPRIDAKSALDALGGEPPPPPPGSSLWIPVASHASGAGGSQWRTDVGVLNAGTSQSSIELRLYTPQGVKTKTGYVPAGAQSLLEDVVGQIGYTGSGVLEIRYDNPIRANSRTFNLVSGGAACYPNGTFGQGYEAYRAADGLAAGQSAFLPGLRESAAYRTNIGLANFGGGTAQVTVELVDGAGNSLTSYDVTLNPGDWKQENRPFFNKAGQTNMTRGYAKVTVSSGSGVVAVASVIDNQTSDPTTILMLR